MGMFKKEAFLTPDFLYGLNVPTVLSKMHTTIDKAISRYRGKVSYVEWVTENT
jgi:hypothetical protein